MAARAIWKGFLKLAELSCPVALHTAVSASERMALNLVNRETGHRLHRQYMDAESGEPVPPDSQVKGYETGSGQYVVLEPDEIAAAMPESDKVLDLQAFIPCADIDEIYFDRPYFLGPGSPQAAEAFALMREGMRAKKVAAIGRTVLFRRMRSVLIRPDGDGPHDHGLIATTLKFDYEIRAAADAFAEIADVRIEGEMLDLARHIIETKKGSFEPQEFEDRYEAALAELVKAKLDGRKIVPLKKVAPTKSNDLLTALRESAGRGGSGRKRARKAG